jgi:hypothetical protein
MAGAPTKYKKEYAKQAYKLCLLGCIDKSLAEFFDVSESTISEWKVTHKEFSEALQGSKIIADANVAEQLYKRCIGFYYDEVTFEKIDSLKFLLTERINTKPYKKKVVRKYVIPDTGAITMWLKNRQKDLWRDKQNHEFEFEKLSNEQLDEIVNRIMKANTKK